MLDKIYKENLFLLCVCFQGAGGIYAHLWQSICMDFLALLCLFLIGNSSAQSVARATPSPSDSGWLVNRIGGRGEGAGPWGDRGEGGSDGGDTTTVWRISADALCRD
jgi:hypothetical protein